MRSDPARQMKGFSRRAAQGDQIIRALSEWREFNTGNSQYSGLYIKPLKIRWHGAALTGLTRASYTPASAAPTAQPIARSAESSRRWPESRASKCTRPLRAGTLGSRREQRAPTAMEEERSQKAAGVGAGRVRPTQWCSEDPAKIRPCPVILLRRSGMHGPCKRDTRPAVQPTRHYPSSHGRKAPSRLERIDGRCLRLNPLHPFAAFSLERPTSWTLTSSTSSRVS